MLKVSIVKSINWWLLQHANIYPRRRCVESCSMVSVEVVRLFLVVHTRATDGRVRLLQLSPVLCSGGDYTCFCGCRAAGQ